MGLQTMDKIAVFSFVLAAVAVLVLSEHCHNYSECHLTMCNDNSTHVSCIMDRCTCLSHVSCNDLADCNNAARCHDRHAHNHCVDHRCLCLKDEHIDEGDKPGPGGPRGKP